MFSENWHKSLLHRGIMWGLKTDYTYKMFSDVCAV